MYMYTVKQRQHHSTAIASTRGPAFQGNALSVRTRRGNPASPEAPSEQPSVGPNPLGSQQSQDQLGMDNAAVDFLYVWMALNWPQRKKHKGTEK